jgi:hypothetical protein
MLQHDYPSKAAEFYKSELPKIGYKISGTMETGDDTANLTLEKGKDNSGLVMIAKDDEKTTMVVSVND